MNKLYTSILKLPAPYKPSVHKEDLTRQTRKWIKEKTASPTWITTRSSLGKPLVLQPPGWYYSHSHSHFLAAASIGKMNMGIDLERVNPQRRYRDLAREYFHKEEIKACLQSEDGEIFFALWTRKEAWLKLHGHSIWNIKETPVLSSPLANILSWKVLCGNESYYFSIAIEKEQRLSVEQISWSLSPDVQIFPWTVPEA